MCVLVSRRGLYVLTAPDIVRVSEVVQVIGVITDIVGRWDT